MYNGSLFCLEIGNGLQQSDELLATYNTKSNILVCCFSLLLSLTIFFFFENNKMIVQFFAILIIVICIFCCVQAQNCDQYSDASYFNQNGDCDKCLAAGCKACWSSQSGIMLDCKATSQQCDAGRPPITSCPRKQPTRVPSSTSCNSVR
jgi:hypothetical protein